MSDINTVTVVKDYSGAYRETFSPEADFLAFFFLLPLFYQQLLNGAPRFHKSLAVIPPPILPFLLSKISDKQKKLN